MLNAVEKLPLGPGTAAFAVLALTAKSMAPVERREISFLFI
jgi:hypothetical protein